MLPKRKILSSLGRDENGFPLQGVDEVPVKVYQVKPHTTEVTLLLDIIQKRDIEIESLKQQLPDLRNKWKKC